MSSSIEEYFQPPEWATKEEVIKAAQHYINYWKIEAKQRNQQWLNALEENARLKAEVERLKSLCDNLGMGGKHTVTAIVEENKTLKAEVDALKLGSLLTAVDVLQFINLKAEVERLTERNKFLEQIDSYLQGANESAYEKRCDELEAEVERLRKAGDYLADHLAHEFGTCPSIEIWNAAKEGKQP